MVPVPVGREISNPGPPPLAFAAEARILLEAAAARAHTEQLYASALRAENNLAAVLYASDRYAEALELIERTIGLAHRRGDRRWESLLRTGSLMLLFPLGRWDEALAIAAEEEPLVASEVARNQLLAVALVHCERGDREAARALLTAADTLRDSDNSQSKTGYAAAEARVPRAEGRPAEALASAERGLRPWASELDVTDTSIKTALIEATEAALILSNLDKAEELLAIPESLDPGQLTPFLQAQTARLRARLDAAHDEKQGIDERFRSAASLFRECVVVCYLAVTQLEHAEWLAGQGRGEDAQPLLIGVGETFEQLRATPWLDRAAQITATRVRVKAAIS